MSSPPRLIGHQNLGMLIGRRPLHELAVGYATEQFDRKGECMPTWLIAAGGRIAWFESVWEDEQHKLLHVECMRALMAATSADFYAFITEAYIAKVEAKSEEELADISLADLPKSERDDALLITTFDRAGGFDLTRFLVTIRRPIGPNFLGPRVDEDSSLGSMEGRMWNLLQ